jgi:hypothetical protein
MGTTEAGGSPFTLFTVEFIMKKQDLTLRLAALKPRNPVAALLRARRAAAHAPVKREHNEQHKDLLQRLREAGL